MLHGSRAITSAIRLSLPATAGVVLGLAIACLLVQPHWDDQSWYLYAAGRLLDGGRLYSADIQDTNPPLIIWLSTIPALLAHITHLIPRTAFIWCMSALIAGVLAWSIRLIRNSIAPESNRIVQWLGIIILYLMAVFPGDGWRVLRPDFGQREHIIALLILPYLLSVAGSLAGRRLPKWEATFAGFAAGIAVSLKPHYIVVIAGVEILLLWRLRTFRQLLRPELISVVLGGLVYCAAVWIYTPEYVTKTLPMIVDVYGDFGRVGLLSMLTPKRSIAVICAATLVLIYRRRSRLEGVVTIFLVAGICSFVVFLLQAKGWKYQLLTAEIFVYGGLGVLCVDYLEVLRERGQQGRAARSGMSMLVTVVGCVLALAIAYSVRAAAFANSDWEHDIEKLNAATRKLPAKTAFVAVTTKLDFLFDFAMERDFVWASRYPDIFMLPAIVQAQQSATGQQGGLSRERANSYAQVLRDTMIDDLNRWQPAFILLDTCGHRKDDACSDASGHALDVPQWFMHDAKFAKFIKRYNFVARIDYYDLYMVNNRLYSTNAIPPLCSRHSDSCVTSVVNR